jgi:cytoskeletal protein CcmA (bactofilin family)
MSSIGEGSLSSASEDTNRPAFSEAPRTSLTDHQKFMAEHSGKDILSSDVEIKGSIKFKKELLIDGKVEGEINSEGVLTIGENADIRGEIKTKSIVVFGKVQGNITVNERCELKSKCTLQGDLKAARLVIEEGATFIGKSEVTSGMSVKPAASGSSRPEVVRSNEESSAKPAFARA